MKEMKILKVLIVLLLFPTIATAKRNNPEKYYQNKYCTGEIEFVLQDKSRVDCLTDTYAFEYDFADKWAEGLGQALYYSAMTGKKAAIAIIIEKEAKDKAYLYRLRKAIKKNKLNVHVVLIKE